MGSNVWKRYKLYTLKLKYMLNRVIGVDFHTQWNKNTPEWTIPSYWGNDFYWINKSDAKELTYKVFFGQNRDSSKYDKLFSSLFPTIHNFIKLYKKESGDYKIMAHDLQKAESNLIYNRINENNGL